MLDNRINIFLGIMIFLFMGHVFAGISDGGKVDALGGTITSLTIVIDKSVVWKAPLMNRTEEEIFRIVDDSLDEKALGLLTQGLKGKVYVSQDSISFDKLECVDLESLNGDEIFEIEEKIGFDDFGAKLESFFDSKLEIDMLVGGRVLRGSCSSFGLGDNKNGEIVTEIMLYDKGSDEIIFATVNLEGEEPEINIVVPNLLSGDSEKYYFYMEAV
jgi:hypothetical protein